MKPNTNKTFKIVAHLAHAGTNPQKSWLAARTQAGTAMDGWFFTFEIWLGRNWGCQFKIFAQ